MGPTSPGCCGGKALRLWWELYAHDPQAAAQHQLNFSGARIPPSLLQSVILFRSHDCRLLPSSLRCGHALSLAWPVPLVTKTPIRGFLYCEVPSKVLVCVNFQGSREIGPIAPPLDGGGNQDFREK